MCITVPDISPNDLLQIIKDIIKKPNYVTFRRHYYFSDVILPEIPLDVEEKLQKWLIQNYQQWACYIRTISGSSSMEYNFHTSAYDDAPYASEFIGFNRLKNGFTFVGFRLNCGKTFPICKIVYWDGENLRGYTPVDGNLYNTDHQQPYTLDRMHWGSLQKRFPQLFPTKEQYQQALEILNNIYVSTDEEQNAIEMISRAMYRHLNTDIWQEAEINFDELHSDYKKLLQELETKFAVQ